MTWSKDRTRRNWKLKRNVARILKVGNGENTQHWVSSEFQQERTVFSLIEHFSRN